MMRHVTPRLAVCLIAAWGAASLLTGCDGSASETGTTDSAWTVTEGELALEKDLLLTDSGDFYFGRIYDVAVRGDGRIYVADGEEHHVKVLSPEGELLETIGAQGEGPGEFARPQEVALARGDSLYVLDGYTSRVSVFTPDHDFAYSFMAMARDEPASPDYMMVPEEQPGYIFVYSAMLSGEEERKRPAVRQVGSSGAVGDTLFTIRPSDVAMERDGGRRTFYPLPYARRSHVAMGPGENLHYAWSDSLRVAVYDRSGEELHAVEVPFEAVPITREDRERELADLSDRSRSFVWDRIAETKPAFDRFLVDEEGRYWFKRPTEDPEQADWWIADPEAEQVFVASLPSYVDLRVVRNDYAYGQVESEGGAPALVRYRIEE